ncbi:7826_t:CDS:2, partial [Acaulospora colombiana]
KGYFNISVDIALPFVVFWRFAKPLLAPFLNPMEDIQQKPRIIVSWGKERIYIDFEENGAGSLEKTTLKQLKERLKNITGVPVNGQKLLFSGAMMKDETAALASFGLHPSSKVLLLGTRPNARDLAQTTNGSPEEHALITRISLSVEKTNATLISQIESFESSVAIYLSSTDHDLATRSKLMDTHHFIIETLMQSLLTLDSVVCPPEFETARQKRKEAVKYTQGLIDRVDVVKEQLTQFQLQNPPFN